MDNKVQKIYDEMLKNQSKVATGSIAEQLQLKELSNAKLDTIIAQMNAIVVPFTHEKRVVAEMYAFKKAGRILSILRYIRQNGKYVRELLKVTGLSQCYIDIYLKICGNLPYYSKPTKTINYGIQMDIEATREFIPIVAAKLGVVIDEDDMSTVTQEVWDQEFADALEKAIEDSQAIEVLPIANDEDEDNDD
jgi:hypothetical protein